jgi:ActR/RegA family two-component response regulator
MRRKMNQEKSSKSSAILIVDDDEDFMNSLEFVLHANGLKNIECCKDSSKVMALLKKKKFSLILLDLIMKPISGLELLPKIVRKYPELPVIVLTGDNDIKTVVTCMKYGAFDYLPKPPDLPRLIKTVRDSLDFINLEKDSDILKEFDFSNEKDISDHSKAPFKIDYLLRTGKAQLVISRIAPLIENKHIDKSNVHLFYVMGQAFEKTEDYGKAAGIYNGIKEFNPAYPGIWEKIKKIEKLKKEIVKIYHKERYTLIERVGKGGIGVVYKAKDNNLERMVALKILNRDPISEKKDIERFISEAKKVAKLKHTNIVGVYDFGQIENEYFISMEFIEGINLESIIHLKHPIPIPGILVITEKLFAALAHSHQHGVIHRDIKPKNIMISYENEVKVVDFGIAVLRDELKKEYQTVTYGTPQYMSPEQFENSATDHLSDIYAAGITLYHLATGEPPFDDTSYIKIMNMHLCEVPPPIEQLRNDIPEELVYIIKKCMEKKKSDRYQDARQVIDELNGIWASKGKKIVSDMPGLEIFNSNCDTLILPEEKSQTSEITRKFESSKTTIPLKQE